MPIFVHGNNNIEQDPNIDAIKVEMKVMVSLPAEYQENKDDPNKEVLEPPKPNEEDIQFEVLEQFKCYARYFYFIISYFYYCVLFVFILKICA